jgi:hypothetical protein
MVESVGLRPQNSRSTSTFVRGGIDSLNAIKDQVNQPIDEYYETIPALDMIEALMGGTESMRIARTDYLPQEPDESDQAYEVRLGRTVLFNAFRRTLLYLSGQVFSTPVILESDVPSKIKDYAENIDQKGNNLTVFCKKWFTNGIGDGVGAILVEYPRVNKDEVKTKADEDKLGLRPYWVLIKARDIIGWRTEVTNGKERLTQVRIRETVRKPEGAFGLKTVLRVRVLEPGRFQLWEYQEGQDVEVGWKLVESDTMEPLKEIPLVLFKPGEDLTYITADPPLEDLAYLNVAHWQSSSDQRNILHYARVPILFGILIGEEGKEPGEIPIAPTRMIVSRHEGADLKFVEHSGAAIESGRQDLTDLEDRMSLYGLQLLMPRTGDITATDRALSSAENDSTLKSWALMFKDAVEQALYFTAQLMGMQGDAGGSAVVNSEFRLMQAPDADVLLRACIAKALPIRIVIEEFIRRGMISDTIDPVAVEKEMKKEIEEERKLNAANKMLSVKPPDATSSGSNPEDRQGASKAVPTNSNDLISKKNSPGKKPNNI